MATKTTICDDDNAGVSESRIVFQNGNTKWSLQGIWLTIEIQGDDFDFTQTVSLDSESTAQRFERWMKASAWTELAEMGHDDAWIDFGDLKVQSEGDGHLRFTATPFDEVDMKIRVEPLTKAAARSE